MFVKDIVKQRHFPLTSNLKRGCGYVLLANHRKWPEFKTVLAKTISCNWVLITNDGMLLMRQTKASEGSEQTKHWRGKSIVHKQSLAPSNAVSSQKLPTPLETNRVNLLYTAN